MVERQLVDVVLIGAAKSGTTTLANLLSEHPDVSLAFGKEPGFFSRNKGLFEGGPPDAPVPSGKYELGVDWYMDQFDKDVAKVRCDASTLYMYSPDSPALLRRHAPRAHVVAVVRDPVQRTISHLAHEMRHDPALSVDDLAKGDDHPRVRHVRMVSRYSDHLERWASVWGRESVLLLTTDELGPHRLHRTLGRLAALIGLDDRPFTRVDPTRRDNPGIRMASPRAYRWIIQPRIRATLLPMPLRRMTRPVRDLLVRLNARAASAELVPMDVRERLAKDFLPDKECVEDWLGRSLTDWCVEARPDGWARR